MRTFVRLVLYVGILVLSVWGVGRYGYDRSQNDFYGTVYNKPVPALQGVKLPAYDPKRPTVAIVMGQAATEDFDFLIPYELFSRAEAFNVYAVAPDTHLKSLTGGLDVLPHYSFAEMDALLGKGPDILVVPNMMDRNAKGYEPVRDWIRQHADATILTICGGSLNLADAGLLKDRSAATHWQLVSQVKTLYPETRWVEDQRYVVDGNLITSAGQTAGIDAILYLISQRLGEPVAQRVAAEIHYPSYQFVHNPKVDPFAIDLRFGTYILNNAFQWQKQDVGVLLYTGMDEMALSSIFDTYADTGTTRVHAVSAAKPEQVIVTKHGLNLFARNQIEGAPKLDKLIVPGAQAKTLAAEELKLWQEQGRADELLLVHSASPDRFVFEAPLEALAKQEDLLTAGHAVKRLEYRANNLRLEGRAFSLETYGNLLLTAGGALLVAFCIDRRWLRRKRRFSRPTGEPGVLDTLA